MEVNIMKMLKLTSENLLEYPNILKKVSQLSLDISKHEQVKWLKPMHLKQKDPMKPEDRYYNVGYILSGYYTAYVLLMDFQQPVVNDDIDNREVVGMLITNESETYSNTLSLCFMYVRPVYRGNGYGKELMKKFLATVPSNHNVMLNCFWNNTTAMKFYESCGFNHLRATFIRRGNKKGKKNVH